jgi:hypothetical protein
MSEMAWFRQVNFPLAFPMPSPSTVIIVTAVATEPSYLGFEVP